MPPETLALRSRHVVLPHAVVDAVVVIRDGRIAAIEVPGAASGPIEDLGEAWLLPGLVDTHVHIDDPGRAHWGGFARTTMAAARGGVTTLVDMPLNSIPATTSAAALGEKRAAARGRCHVDVAFWGGVVPGNTADLAPLAVAGVRGFKCFLSPSGVDEFHHVSAADLRAAMPVVASLGLPLLAHAEWPAVLDAAIAAPGADPRRHATWLASRPPEAELEAIRFLIREAEATGCAVHVVHLSAAAAVPELRAARARGVPVTVETCPHYLTLAAEDVPDGATEFKCAPPLRSRANAEALWDALREGVIDLVASDHSPCPIELKLRERGDFLAAWGGIASLDVGLAAVWAGARARGFTPSDVARWMAERPARLAGIGGAKGRIAPGADADLVAWEPDGAAPAPEVPSPYAGRALAGEVRATWVRGHVVHRANAHAPAIAPVGGEVRVDDRGSVG